MIEAIFFSKSEKLVGFNVKGHSGYAEAGFDIVCSAVSSASYLTANTITEVLKIPANVTVNDGDMELHIDIKNADACKTILEGFRLHLVSLGEQYKKYIHVKFTEV
ncbi:MAG: ribosomal-processing cysteine protease Prp [Bacillota bacterium]|nr:ribosomal-processing cysteine protease Prp [Bacillota bacterium]